MYIKCKEFITKHVWIIFVVPAILRIWLGALAGIFFLVIKAMMMQYAGFPVYYGEMAKSAVSMTMLKEMGEPVFMWLVNLSGLPLSMVMSGLWIVNGLLAYRLVDMISSKKKMAYFFFLFIVFNPVAFDKWCGVRLYRSSVSVPMYLLVFLIMLLLFVRLERSNSEGYNLSSGRVISDSLCIGFLFTLAYYLKEDGMWFFLCASHSLFYMLYALLQITWHLDTSEL